MSFSKNAGLLLPIAIIIVVGIAASLPLPWQSNIKDYTSDLLFQIRGHRDWDDSFLFVYLGPDDIETLGGWPVTRDYYGYLMHVLIESDAEVIALYFLFDSNDSRYPEYDTILADFFQKAGNVCLPMAMQAIQPDGKTAIDPIHPIAVLRKAAAQIGFSNLNYSGKIYTVPLSVSSDSEQFDSYGAALARLMGISNDSSPVIPNINTLRLNHFGTIDNIHSIGFVDLLQTFENEPDALNLKNRIVIVDVTAPGIASLRPTPFAGALPASLIHATAAENLLNSTYIRTTSPFWEWLFIVLGTLLIWTAGKNGRSFILPATLLLIVAINSIIAIYMFSYHGSLVPFFYPFLANTVTAILVLRTQTQIELSERAGLTSMLQQEIQNREETLRIMHAEIDDLKQHHAMAENRRLKIQMLENQIQDLKTYSMPEETRPPADFPEIIHKSDGQMANILRLIETIRADDVPVLIIGETGTGKELVAGAIHRASRRKGKPFVAVNCGALPETLLESELFGHERGSFTGATSRRQGRFELADGGTIFLDEVTETTQQFQLRLLRVLQENKFERIGGEQTISVDVRIIAATNRDIQDEIATEKFRSDLYYRLNGFPIEVPPLRSRQDDIPLLINHFLNKYDYTDVTGCSNRVVDALNRYNWPGNVRELENVIRRGAILAQGENRKIIQQADLPHDIAITTQNELQPVEYHSQEQQILDSLRRLKFSRSAITQTASTLGNKDRGTITEYFRGICFRQLVESAYDKISAAEIIAGCPDQEVIDRVARKIEQYLSNLYPLPSRSGADSDLRKSPQYAGLPKKYHDALDNILEHLRKQEASKSE